jgi:predicted NBD/HSP70 family sugar kinase
VGVITAGAAASEGLVPGQGLAATAVQGTAATAGQPARPPLIRAMNEQLLLDRIRLAGPLSRADLARVSSLSKPTVSLALANLERAGLVQEAGQRTGVPGRSALLYEVRPESGFVLGLDIGAQFMRGALADLSGEVRARSSCKAVASSMPGRLAQLVRLADNICADVGISRSGVTQTVIGSPGVYDPRRDAMTLTGGLQGLDRPAALAGLREAFGPALAVVNDVDAEALAERAHGHGQDTDNFAFVHVGTGIGMGLVIGGKLHRGAHGVAGEIAYLPLADDHEVDPAEARRRGVLESVVAASAIVRAARRAGMRGPVSARRVFEAAARGDERASAVVAEEARLVAGAICCIIAVADPELIVLGGGIGQALGFAEAVSRSLRAVTPVMPEVRVSALGTDAVVDGCLAEGAGLAWQQLTSTLIGG